MYKTLDPNITNPYFIMFNDGKLVFSIFKKDHSPENRKYFEILASSLGKEMFSDGYLYREVAILGKSIRTLFGLSSLGRKGCVYLADHGFLFTEPQKQPV